MAYTITSSTYPPRGPRKPTLTVEADSLDDLQQLTNAANGSTADVGGKTYTMVDGVWSDGSGGGTVDVNTVLDENIKFTFHDGEYPYADYELSGVPFKIYDYITCVVDDGEREYAFMQNESLSFDSAPQTIDVSTELQLNLSGNLNDDGQNYTLLIYANDASGSAQAIALEAWAGKEHHVLLQAISIPE